MTAPPVGISVVTPTLGAPDLVELLLRSTAEAGRRSGVPWEHIVVDDSRDADAERIRAACHRHGAQYHRGPRRVGAKRNVGARAARHDLLLFVDSDCVADRDLFTEHLRAHTDGVAAVAGPTDMYGPADGFRFRVLALAKQYNHCYSWPRRYREMGWSTTSNLSVRADAFATVGGFDERTLTVVGGEDVDLGVRLRKAGHRIVTNPRATVEHTRSLIRLRRVAHRVFWYGMADGWLCGRHPDLTVPYGNPLVLSAAAGLAGAAVRRRPAAALPVFLAATAAQLGREALSRRGSGARDTAAALVCTVVDLCFDAGEVWAAVRCGRPQQALRRFRYVQPGWFTPAGDQR